MTTINQKEYLKKYLSIGNEPGKKKKRKKKSSTSERVRIIDDDIDIATFNQAVEEDLQAQNEDAPQIVGVIDDRPLELRIGDYRDSDLWKPIGAETEETVIGENSLQKEMKPEKTHNETRTVSHKYNDDYSPPRRGRNRHSPISDSNDRSPKAHKSDTRRDSDRGANRSGRSRDFSPVGQASGNFSSRGGRTNEDLSPARQTITRKDGSPRYRNTSLPRRYRGGNDVSPVRKDRRGSNTSPSRRIRKDSDSSPNRTSRQSRDMSPIGRNKRDNNMSPARRNRSGSFTTAQARGSTGIAGTRNRRDNDTSPVRRSRRDSDVSPARRYRRESDVSPSRRTGRNADISPARRTGRNSDMSPVRRTGRNNDISPVRRNRRDSDVSPARRSRRDNYVSPIKRNRWGTDGSPPRRQRNHISPFQKSGDRIPGRTERNKTPPWRNRRDSDLHERSLSRNSRRTPPGPSRRGSDTTQTKSFEKSSRWRSRSREYVTENTENKEDKYRSERNDKNTSQKPSTSNSEKDLQEASTSSRIKSRWDQELPKTETPEPVPKFLDPRKSGLQRANDIIMGKEPSFQLSSDFADLAGFSGGNAAPIIRDRKTGKIRDFKKEEEDAKKKQEREDEMKAKYAKWGKGLKQVEDATEKLNSDIHEMNKPLARYADDEDLEKHLKEMEREGDPMLDYLRKKRKKTDVEAGKPMKPEFLGEFMPNRYGIRPGHRWDGVDRSSGYEQKWFEVMNSRRAQQEDAYKWSTEDM